MAEWGACGLSILLHVVILVDAASAPMTEGGESAGSSPCLKFDVIALLQKLS